MFRNIRYELKFFVEWLPGCEGDSENYPLNRGAFIGVSHSCRTAKRMVGVATRVWRYSRQDALDGKEFGSYPATDEPDEAYKTWISSKPNGIVY